MIIKNILAFIFLVLFIFTDGSSVYAKCTTPLGCVTPPYPFPPGAAGINKLLVIAVQAIFMISAIAFLFMFFLGLYHWITSGGDKEALARAKSSLINATIGIIFLAIAFPLLGFLGGILGIKFFI